MLEAHHWLVTVPIAHRGLYDRRSGRPENSLAAFDAAAAEGFPCELDVQATRAGELIVVHDTDLTALTGEAIRSEALTPDLRVRVRLGGTREGIPTLAEVLERVAGKVPLLIELKHPALSAGTHLVRAVLGAVRSYRGAHAFASFDPFLVWALRRARPGAPVGQISGLLRSGNPASRLIMRSLLTNHLTRPDFLSYELAGLPSASVARWRRRGMRVLAWPVESPDDEARAMQFADNIIFGGYRPQQFPTRGE
jgi:glycerophosphoryl diester phosphodiesterase